MQVNNFVPEEDRKRALTPWIVVAVIAVVALIAAGMLIAANAGNNGASQTAGDASKQTAADGSSSKTDNVPETVVVPKAEVPTAQVGSTMQLTFTQVGKTLDLSSKFGSTQYELIEHNTKARLTSQLINALPESCAEMRQQFGFDFTDPSAVKVMRPETSCTESPAVYNEIWGLLEAAAKTAR